MSSKEETDRDKREPEDEVVAHRYVADEAGEDDLAAKKKRHESEAPEGDEFGKRKK